MGHFSLPIFSQFLKYYWCHNDFLQAWSVPEIVFSKAVNVDSLETARYGLFFPYRPGLDSIPTLLILPFPVEDHHELDTKENLSISNFLT